MAGAKLISLALSTVFAPSWRWRIRLQLDWNCHQRHFAKVSQYPPSCASILKNHIIICRRFGLIRSSKQGWSLLMCILMFTALLRMLWTFSRNFVDTWRKKGDCWEPVLKCGDKNPRCSHDCLLSADCCAKIILTVCKFSDFYQDNLVDKCQEAVMGWWSGVENTWARAWRLRSLCKIFATLCSEQPSTLHLETGAVQIIVQNIHNTGR